MILRVGKIGFNTIMLFLLAAPLIFSKKFFSKQINGNIQIWYIIKSETESGILH